MASASTQSQIRSQPNEKRPGDNGSGSGSARSGGSGSIGIRNPKPNKRIEHITTIAAPIDVVWKSLVNVQDWTWNQWTRLDIGTQTPVNGLKGKLKACYEGNDKDWQTFDFEFAEVNAKNYILAWKGSVLGGCLFSGYHTMRLESIDGTGTRLIHTEVFGGLLPLLKLGLPYTTLDRNYRLMNESLKNHIEKQAKQ